MRGVVVCPVCGAEPVSGCDFSVCPNGHGEQVWITITLPQALDMRNHYGGKR